MNITRENKDALNAVVKVDIDKKDYQEKVDKILSDYRKTANIPGFRKGHVPMQMIKKQYRKSVIADEVNKLLDNALSTYLKEEKLDILGRPLPKAQDAINWDADTFSFEFELGLAPEFEVNLKTKKPITSYKIVADDKTVNDQVERLQKQFGKISPQKEADKNSEITGQFINEEHNINASTTITLDQLKGKTNPKKLIGVKVGDSVALKTKNLFKDDHDLIQALKIDHDKVHDLDIEVLFEIKEVNKRELAELDQEFFDKILGKDQIKSVTELKDRIKTDSEKQFIKQADQKLVNDVTEALVEQTKFDLPSEFLQKWLQQAGEKQLNELEARQEYENAEKGIRYQLIESKLLEANNININFEDVKTAAKNMIKAQMAQFGQLSPSEKELDDIAARVLSNQEEVRRISEQVVSEKLLELYKEKANLKAKEVNYDTFVKEVYGDK